MKILLATDGSSGAMEACWLVARLPCREKETLLLLSVVPLAAPVGATEMYPNPAGVTDMYPTLVDLTQAHREHSDADLAAAARVFDGFPGAVQTLQATGHIPTEILHAAEAEEADLIVIGARGHSALERIVLGSVSDRVATHAETSVMVVRPTGLREAADRPPRVTIAIDGSATSQGVVTAFKKFAWGPRVPVQIVTVVPTTQLFRQDMAVDLGDHTRQWYEEAQRHAARAAEAVRQVAPETTTRIVAGDHIGQALVDAAAEHQSDLIVIGDTSGGGLKRFLLGSSSRYVLRHADCSVWIVRPGDQPDVAEGAART